MISGDETESHSVTHCTAQVGLKPEDILPSLPLKVGIKGVHPISCLCHTGLWTSIGRMVRVQIAQISRLSNVLCPSLSHPQPQCTVSISWLCLQTLPWPHHHPPGPTCSAWGSLKHWPLSFLFAYLLHTALKLPCQGSPRSNCGTHKMKVGSWEWRHKFIIPLRPWGASLGYRVSYCLKKQ